jgi:hypothetical protein
MTRCSMAVGERNAGFAVELPMMSRTPITARLTPAGGPLRRWPLLAIVPSLAAERPQ